MFFISASTTHSTPPYSGAAGCGTFLCCVRRCCCYSDTAIPLQTAVQYYTGTYFSNSTFTITYLYHSHPSCFRYLRNDYSLLLPTMIANHFSAEEESILDHSSPSCLLHGVFKTSRKQHCVELPHVQRTIIHPFIR